MAEKITVKTWGFPPGSFGDWPADLEPSPADDSALPTGDLLVVHADAIERFQEAVGRYPYTGGDVQPAVLYRASQSAQEPDDAWMYFLETVETGDWPALRDALECSHKHEAAQAAQDVEVSDLNQALALTAVALEGSEATPAGEVAVPPGVEPDTWEHIVSCATCLRVFRESLEERRLWSYQVLCPPVARLQAYTPGRVTSDAWVEAHLRVCPACLGEVKALARVKVPSLVVVLLDRLAESIEAKTESLVAIVKAFGNDLRNGLTPMRPMLGAGSRMLGSSEQDIPESVKEGHLTWIGKEQQMTVVWTTKGRALRIEDLRGASDEPITEFVVELQRDGVKVWDAHSKDNQVELPLDELAKAVEAGANRLVIRAEAPSLPEESEGYSEG